jgi:hypothetical protein
VQTAVISRGFTSCYSAAATASSTGAAAMASSGATASEPGDGIGVSVAGAVLPPEIVMPCFS